MQKANQKLEALLALWHEKRGARPMPSRTDLPVSVLRPWLGNLALIDLAGSALYFRLCGTGLYSRFGGEMTRRKLDALEDQHGQQALREAIHEVRRTGKPRRAIYVAESSQEKTRFHELYVPLAQDGATADMLLFASYAEQKT